MKKTPFILLKITLFLLTAIFFIGHNLAQAEEKPVAERLVSVNLEDQDFTQALKTIADQAGITINIHGQTPAGKRDISINQMPLNQALAHILRIYGVRNHAAAYNPETGTVMLAILETSTLVAALSPQAQPRIDISLDEPLTPEQL
jgi:type II secretory pathway component GspD/PulD (secretin)